MKNTILLLLLLWSTATFGQSQKQFFIDISSDTLGVGEHLDIRYTIKGMKGSFTPPAFEDWPSVTGPFRSSQVSIINGQVKSDEVISYRLQSDKPGTLTIEPASYKGKEEVHHFPAVSVMVISEGTDSQLSSNLMRFYSSDSTATSPTQNKLIRL